MLHVVVTADLSGPLVASANVIATLTPDPIPANNHAALGLAPPPQADIQITASATTPLVTAGTTAGYLATVTNNGEETAFGLTVATTVTVGGGSIQSGVPSSGVFNVGTGQWSIASLAKGSSATLALGVLTMTGPTLAVQAQASSSTSDPLIANNTAGATVSVATRATSTVSTLSASTIIIGQESLVTATVTDVEGTGIKSNPIGLVTFSSSVPSDTFTNVSCTLAPVPATSDQSSCQVSVTPSTASVHVITATYAGSTTHTASAVPHDLTVNKTPTTTTAANATATASETDHTVTLTATVTSTSTVDEGTVTFTVRDAGSVVVGTPVVSAPLTAGVATVMYQLPGGTAQQTLTILAEYTGVNTFANSSDDTKTLDVTASPLTLILDTPDGASTFSVDASFYRLFGSTDVGNTVTFTTSHGDTGSIEAGASIDSHSTPIARAGELAPFMLVLPLHAGDNVVVVTATNPAGATISETLTITVSTLTYSLAEGVTGPFFDTYLLIANPNTTAASATITYLKDDGGLATQDVTVPAERRITLSVDSLPGVNPAAFATKVTSLAALPLVVERATFFDTSSHAGTVSSASSPASKTWYFAEGSLLGTFSTYLLLENAGSTPATVQVTFLTESGAAVTRAYAVAQSSRLTVAAAAIPELANTSFGMVVTSDVPITAERAQYLGAPLTGGHTSQGAPVLSTQWYHAEGATGLFDMYLLLLNPNTDPATVTLTYRTAGGSTVTKVHSIPGRTRLTVDAREESPLLGDTAAWTTVTSDLPIVSERSMYWRSTPGGAWIEGHSSLGLADASTKWGFAEGAVGGELAFQPYYLIANPSAVAADVTITFLRQNSGPIVKAVSVPANGRVTLGIPADVLDLHDESFGALITSTLPIVAERAMYWMADGLALGGGASATAVKLP